jgi:hypothetical protein
MRGILASHRWRRRILWALPPVAVAVGFAALVASLPRGSGIPDEEPSAAPPSAPEPAEVAPVRRPVPVTPGTRREVNAVLTAFVRHAVRRDNPAAAWDLATPALKAGQTRAEWRRGDLPVFPFPAKVNEATGWYAVESFEDDLLVTLVMHAPARTKRGAIAYQVELKRVGVGNDRRWLVNSFVPERVYTPPAAEKPTRDAAPQPSSVPTARLSSWWFVVPGILLSLIVLVPVTILLVSWRRGVRAEKRYRRSLTEAE